MNYDSTEAELQKHIDSWRLGQRWQWRNRHTNGQWKDWPQSMQPGWFFDSQYRQLT